MISASGIRFSYGQHEILDAVDLDAPHGQVLGLVGPNGSGKTTLLRTLHASLKPRAGAVLIDGEQLSSLSAREVARRVAVVVQESTGDLPLLVSDMVLLGRTPHRSGFGRHGTDDERIAADALDRVGALHLADKPFDGLSGGERQRVLIARALAQESTHLLLDEPTNHLDVRYQHEVLDLARRLAVEGGHTVVVILHDLNLAATYCDRVLLLHRGAVVAAGSPDHVLTTEHLEPVYEVAVRRLDLDDGFHLAFRPLSPTRSPERMHR
ncbi:ABC transporter ATP-binding protein [Nocardioides sp. cx-173]|uniref:ABC transporter ATP-binding protein n=1 Tax=Nocardioides sp. cx-173 TaxID=2898796 RepID=UPI0022ABE85E|nr:ABC transporter ATP-binding protein [Nocardioides sp. cx-173]